MPSNNKAFHPLCVAENDSLKVVATILNLNCFAICLKIFLYPLASVLPALTSLSGLNPKQFSASSSLPIQISTYFINGLIMLCAFSLVHNFFLKLRSQDTKTPNFLATLQASNVNFAEASDIAGVIPEK